MNYYYQCRIQVLEGLPHLPHRYTAEVIRVPWSPYNGTTPHWRVRYMPDDTEERVDYKNNPFPLPRYYQPDIYSSKEEAEACANSFNTVWGGITTPTDGMKPTKPTKLRPEKSGGRKPRKPCLRKRAS